MKTQSLDELTDKYIGKKGTEKRDEFDKQTDQIGYAKKSLQGIDTTTTQFIAF